MHFISLCYLNYGILPYKMNFPWFVFPLSYFIGGKIYYCSENLSLEGDNRHVYPGLKQELRIKHNLFQPNEFSIQNCE